MKNHHSSSIWPYAKRHQRAILLLILIFSANVLLQVFAPEALSRFLDAVESGGSLRRTFWMILFYMAALALQTLAALLLTYLSQKMGCLITDDYRHDILSHYLGVGLDQHVRWTSGEMMTRLDEDVEGLFTYYYILILKLAGSGVLLLCVLATLTFRSGILSAALLLLSLLTIFVFKRIQDRAAPKYVRNQASIAEFNGSMKEMVDNAVIIRAMAATAYIVAKFKDAMQKRFQEGLPAGLMYGNLWTASTMMQGITLAAALFISVWLWDAHILTVGTVYLIIVYTDLIYGPLQEFRDNLGRMQAAKASILRVSVFLSIPQDVRRGHEPLSGKAMHLSVRGVRFAYEDGPDVLRGISFDLRPGESLGIMGQTGCGKSTLVHLLAGLNTRWQGEIRLDGVDIRAIAPKDFHRHVAYCAQNVQLFHGTLRDNITLFDRQYAD
ncbi:MAG TPA: ABC transporter ATP-binding protein, partial [Clostridia bacterium]|nr:ABC transporter ATP-binding protein [Clostridia bacterium]